MKIARQYKPAIMAFVAVIGIAGSLFASSGVAHAASTTLKAGDRIGYTGSDVDLCTVAAVGTDSLGNKVALTAGHCLWKTGTDLKITKLNASGIYVPADKRTEIGTVGTWKFDRDKANPDAKNNILDYGFVRLNNDVQLQSVGKPNVAAPGIGQMVTRVGNDAGVYVSHLAIITGYSDRDFAIGGALVPGASGGPVTRGDALIGIASRSAFFYAVPGSFITRVDAAIADATAAGGVGANFKPL